MSRRTILILVFVFGIVMLSIVGVVFILQQNQPVETVTDGEDGAPAPDGVDVDKDRKSVGEGKRV